MPILAALVAVGLAPDAQDNVDEAVEVLEGIGTRCARGRTLEKNQAKDLARRLLGQVPLIYGASGLTGTAAYRFKCDLNEYGKTPAFWNQLPELDHNEIVGWAGSTHGVQESFVAVALRDPKGENDRIQSRFDVTLDLIGDSFAEIVSVEAEGRSDLARLLSLVAITQLASIYVGIGNGVDPGPVDVIEDLKRQLADR